MPSESPQDSPYTSYNQNEEATAVPELMSPVMDRGVPYLPYRGTAFHGVEPTNIPIIDDGQELPDDAVITDRFEPPTEDAHPVPVRIVDTAAHEYSQWRAWQSIVSTSVTMVANRKEGQNNLRIRNFAVQGTNRVWIGPDPSVSSYTGYPLSGNDEVIFSGEAPVYAVADTGTVTLAVLSEFSTAQ